MWCVPILRYFPRYPDIRQIYYDDTYSKIDRPDSELQNKKNRGTERYWDVSLRWRFAANQRWCETNRPSNAPVFICKLFSTRLFTCDLCQKFSSDLWMTMTSYMSDQTFLMVAMQSRFGDPSMVMGQFCWLSPYWVILFGSDNSIFISVGG